jgi:menaquinone-dependent protoporphyrinogen oxidase
MRHGTSRTAKGRAVDQREQQVDEGTAQDGERRRVLVATASRHGATGEIGSQLAQALRDAGLEVDEREAGDVDDLGGYDAALIGSGIYVGKWLRAARALVTHHRAELSRMPVWLFSSGPVGDPPSPGPELTDGDYLAEEVGARAHVVLSGRLEREGLGWAERAAVRLVHAPYGDFRSSEEVAALARAVAAELVGTPDPAADSA